MIAKHNFFLAALALLPSIALSTPTIALGSKHNVYLANCDPNECPIGLCDPGDFHLTAAIYFKNGPIAEGSTSVQRPSGIGKVSGNKPAWEGAKRTGRFELDGSFVSNISAGAKTAAKGEIAGDGTLGDEPFVCFKDGTTKFQMSYDTDRYTCTADYWCGSIETGDS
jgi:hypothetical protein